MILCLERAHGCLGGQSRGAWAASPGPLGRLPGGGPGPKLQGSIRVTSTCRPFEFASKFMSILMSIFGRFGVDLGSLLGVIFRQVDAFFGPSWPRNRPRTDLSSKKWLFTKHYVFLWFLLKIDPRMGPRSTQDRSKTGPRSSWIAFFHLEFSLRFLIVLGSALVPFWPPKWSPGGAAELVVIDAWAVQDNLGIVLVRSFFHLAIRDHFFGPHGCLLESFSAVFGLVLGRLGLSWARFWVLRIAFCNPTTLYAHQLINPSTHGLSALCNSGRRTARSD